MKTSLKQTIIDYLNPSTGHLQATDILGSSTFMHLEVFAGTLVTHLEGSGVRNAAAVEKIVSEGGGTMILKSHMDFETICLQTERDATKR